MKSTVKYVMPGLAAAAIGAAVAFAPIAGATTLATPHTSAATPLAVGSSGADPLVPYGTAPHVSTRLGYIDSNHDEANTTNGEVDLPF
jgi:hypothetical protein